MIYEYECQKCGRVFEEMVSVSDRDNVFCCGYKSERTIVNDFQTDDDLMYQGACSSFSHKPVEIYSRRQYRSLLKEHGMIDTTVKEIKTIKKKKDSDFSYGRSKVVKRMADRMYKDGVLKDVPNFFKDKLGGLPQKLKT